jgi:tRNA pseudouridine55 synthase
MTLPLLDEHFQELLAAQKVLFIDKPSDWTSHDIVNVVRGKTGVRRVGHAGTLDPMATGLLIVLVGREATKYQDYFMHMDKSYHFTAQLGYETDTLDRTGATTHTSSWDEVKKITQEKIEEVVKSFVGTYEQQVPMYSAVRVDGQKLYDLARKGKKVKPPTRIVNITSLQLLGFDIDLAKQEATFECTVECGSGTYIRSLAQDIGQKLHVGATVTSLRRTTIGPFSVNSAQIWEK